MQREFRDRDGVPVLRFAELQHKIIPAFAETALLDQAIESVSGRQSRGMSVLHAIRLVNIKHRRGVRVV
jgi:hypothetical protein